MKIEIIPVGRVNGTLISAIVHPVSRKLHDFHTHENHYPTFLDAERDILSRKVRERIVINPERSKEILSKTEMVKEVIA